MKKLLAYIYISLMFCNVGVAEKISDFEIDGISIGDSLLQYMTKEEILSNQEESNEAYKALGNQIFFEVYKEPTDNDIDFISFFVKSNDKNFIIQAIYATKTYQNDIDQCFARKNKITEQYDKEFKSLKKRSQKGKILYDPSGKSYLVRSTYEFINGDLIAIECYDYDKSFQKNYGYQNPDSLNISFNKKQLYLWINP